MAKLVNKKGCPSIAGLLAVEYVKKQASLTVTEGDSTVLVVNKDTSFTSTASILRYLARIAPGSGLYGANILQKTEVDHWLEFAGSRLSCASDFDAALAYLDSVLGPVTFLVGHGVTIADIAVWAALRGSVQWLKTLQQDKAPQNVNRYYSFLAAQDFFQAVNKQLPKQEIPKGGKPQEAKKERKEEGKFIELPGAEMGKVVVRFPPEASGFLHVGHAKALLLNQYYQQAFKGKLIFRFDDTNPAKENAEYEKIILEDVARLGVKYDMFSHTSDSFDRIMELCEQLIREGKAYVDDTDAETMKKEREERAESKRRNNTVAKNLEMWAAMKEGSEMGLKCAVRAKINMQSDNGCMRDPTIYRCKNEAHVRTGTKYKVYPTYDFACPIVDSVEGVTHSLRTTEYMDRDEQFTWFCDALKLRKPYIWAYSRLNMQNTVMSKRKLTWFVDQGIVDGWDDPRFPTVRGVLRRGMTVEALKQFVIAQGSSRSINVMEWDKIWAVNKKVIDPIVPRYTALLKDSVVPVLVAGVKEESKEVQAHPKDPAVGMKKVWYGSKVLIDGADAESLSVGENVTFINWGNILVKKINRNAAGKVESVEADPNLDNKDYKKTQKLTWMAETSQGPFVAARLVHYDFIITKPILSKEEDFKQFVNKNSKTEYAMLGDPELVKLKKGDIIQLQRRGYYICDSPYEPTSRHTGRESPCILLNIPDGHTKEMPTAGSKHKEPMSAKEKTQSKKGKSAEKSPQEELPPGGPATLSADAAAINVKITDQGNLIRKLKGDKAPKEQITAEVEVLKALKADYKNITGQEWKPAATGGAAPPPPQKQQQQKQNQKQKQQQQQKKQPAASGGNMSSADSDEAKQLKAKIDAQGGKVRDLKGSGADKSEVDSQVKILLGLKAEYKSLTGEDLSGGGGKRDKKGGANKENKAGNTPKQQQAQKTEAKKEDEGAAGREVKKQTRLGLEAKKEENLPEWYSQVITKAEMIEYYDVSGCYVLRPWSFGIWEGISKWFDDKIKEIGFQNCYFPIFVSNGALQKEKEHIEDFAPEVAWVTRSGDSELAEPIAIRPTSETVMYPAYAKWVQSHRDLPIKLNQWCNVVRWEFKHPQPFLRTREFLWQEGHSAYATFDEAVHEVHHIIDLYEEIYETILAIPVVKGKKTVKEKFAGGDFTTTVEAFISATGRGIQAATSHHLGQNFSKMFDISFEDPDTKERRYAYQNSWAITTRSIGVIVMVHGDNKGLVLPPRIAVVQVVVVPCGITANLGEADRKDLMDKCEVFVKSLKAVGIRAQGDYRDNYSPGWKFNHWELKGVPVRVEIGPRDLAQKQFVAVVRFSGEKKTISMDGAPQTMKEMLDQIHTDMFNKAKTELDSHTALCHSFDEFCKNLDQKKLILAPFCGAIPCEEKIKKLSARDAIVEEGAPAMGAKGLCIPFVQPAEITDSMKCVCPDCDCKPQNFTLFGRSY